MTVHKLVLYLKWKAAYWIDDHYPEACWAQLSMWAIGCNSWIDMFWYGEWRVQSCDKHDGAYCGKCVITGKLKE